MPSPKPIAQDEPAVLAFAGGGEVGALMPSVDWSATSLGPVAGWPGSLRTAVRIMLTSRFAMWIGWGADGTFLYNDAYARMTLGRKHPWALGRRSDEVWAEIWEDIGPRLASVRESGVATWDEELRLFLERSGFPEESYHTFSYSPLADDDGTVAGTLCVVTEVTERVVGERRLGTLRELATALTGTSSVGDVCDAARAALGTNVRDLPFTLLYLFDDVGSARLASSTGVEPASPVAPGNVRRDDPGILGLPLGTVAALDRSQVWSVDHVAGLPRGAWDRPPRDAMVVPLWQPGQERLAGFLVAGLNPHRELDEKYASFVELIAGQLASSLADARAQEEERRRAESLAELDRTKSAFFSNVSHELRTPLTLILGPTEDALADPDLPAEQRERLTLVHRNAVRLHKLVNSLLDFSRIEAGRMNSTAEETDIGAYTAEVASGFRSAIERAGLTLELRVPPTPVRAWIDRGQWEKVVLNLLSNALKHTFEGGIVVEVQADEGNVSLLVRDTGVGIAPDQLQRVFDRFHRVPNARSRTHEGTGIGLALVRELVALHGGTIEVESETDRGSTFTVRLPRDRRALDADQGDGAREAVPRGFDDRRMLSDSGVFPAIRAYSEEAERWLPDGVDSLTNGNGNGARPGEALAYGREAPRVLLADDNADMREYVARLLRDEGWEVQAVADGAAALEAARRSPPDLVLSDVMMPRLDGIALVAALRAEEATRTVPVILLSARAGEGERVEGLETGADDYLVKPFAARELVARVRTALELAGARRQVSDNVSAARDLLMRVLDQAPVAICVFRGPEHVFELANAEYRKLMGGRALIGRRAREVVPEGEAQGYVALLDGVYRTGTPFEGRRMRVDFDRMLDGRPEEAYFDLLYYPLKGADGTPSGIIVVIIEISAEVFAQRAAQDALRDAEEARSNAESANRAKSDFLAVMSHELRTPLNAIAGHVALIEMGVHGPVTPSQAGALARVQRSQQRLLSLINDVLNFAKLEAGKVEYGSEPVPLRELAVSTLALVEPQFAARGLQHAVVVPEALLATADREKAEQIVLNLLTNALKFTGTGGTVTIDGTASDDGSRVELRVTDTGIGIARERLDEIFEPFVQVGRAYTRVSEGTGLGLSISRDLARGMGGDLTVTSEPGAGSTFILTLPAGPAGA